MSSEEKKVVGEKLKRAREAKGLSLQEVALALKIGTKTLRAIEEGNEKNFPAKTFLRGFIQSYAGYLKLDVNEILASFYEEFGSTRPKSEFLPLDQSEKPPVILQRDSNRDPANLKTLVLVGAGLILAIGIIISKKIIDKYQKEAEAPALDSLQTVSRETPTPVNPPNGPVVEKSGDKVAEKPAEKPVEKLTEKSAEKAGSSDAKMGETLEKPAEVATTHSATNSHPPTAEAGATGGKPETKAAEAIAKEENEKKSASKVEAEKSTPKVEAVKPEPTKLETKAAEVEAATETPKVATSGETSKPESAKPEAKLETKSDAKPTEVKEAPKRKNLELIVEALDSVELEYLDSKGQSQKIKLEPDQVHTFKSNAGLKLSVSNGGAVRFILNGKDIGVPGEMGKVIRLNY